MLAWMAGMTEQLTPIVLVAVAAFACGFLAAMQTTVWKNAEQIRRNSETIRRNSEAAIRKGIR